MQLERLAISRETYGVNKGRYTGAVEFTNQSGKVELNLNHEVSLKILGVVSERLVESAKEIANKLSVEAIDGSLLLTQS